MNKSQITTWHGAAAIGALVVVSVALHLFGVSDGIVALATGAVTTLLMSMGLMHAGDQQAIQKVSADLTAQTLGAITTVKEDLTALHAVSTANTAAVAQTVAVHAALIPSAPMPPPLIVAPAAAAPPVEQGPHLVS